MAEQHAAPATADTRGAAHSDLVSEATIHIDSEAEAIVPVPAERRAAPAPADTRGGHSGQASESTVRADSVAGAVVPVCASSTYTPGPASSPAASTDAGPTLAHAATKSSALQGEHNLQWLYKPPRCLGAHVLNEMFEFVTEWFDPAHFNSVEVRATFHVRMPVRRVLEAWPEEEGSAGEQPPEADGPPRTSLQFVNVAVALPKYGSEQKHVVRNLFNPDSNGKVALQDLVEAPGRLSETLRSFGTISQSTSGRSDEVLSPWEMTDSLNTGAANKVTPEEASSLLGAVFGDGMVDLGALLQPTEDPSKEESAKHRPPVFIILQIVVSFGLWLGTGIHDNVRNPDRPWTSAAGGLDYFSPGRTNFQVHADCSDLRFHVWRCLTYQFSHIGIHHIAMNSLLVAVLGIPLEGFHGTWRMAVMFNVGVFGGACFCYVNSIHTNVVGMSGGCYALLGVHLGDLAINWSQRRFRVLKLLVLAAFASYDFLTTSVSHSSGGTSHAAHFGGYVAGVLIALVVGRNTVVRRWERAAQAAAFVLGVALILFCVVWGLHWPPRTIWESEGWCWARQVSSYDVFGDVEWHCVHCSDQVCIGSWSRQMNIEAVNALACYEHGGFAAVSPP